MSLATSGTHEVLVREVGDIVGAHDIRLVRTSGGGASRAGFRVEDARGEAIAFVLMQEDSTGVHAADPAMLREGKILERLHRHGILVPRIFGHLASLPATVLEMMPGTNTIPAQHLVPVTRQFGRLLADVHNLPLDELINDSPANTTIAIDVDLSWWADQAARSGVIGHDIVNTALDVLRGGIPTTGAPACLLHGDAGPGNFLVVEGEITALLDWEMAHPGDFHEDLAWIWARSVHTDFGTIDDAIAAYEAARDVTIDRDALHWHLTFVLTKIVIALSAALLRPGAGQLALTRYNLLLVYRALLCSALARQLGTRFKVLSEPPDKGRSERSALFERLGDLLDDEQREARWLVEILQASAERAVRDGTSDEQPTDPREHVLELCRHADRELHASRRAIALARRAQRIGLGE